MAARLRYGCGQRSSPISIGASFASWLTSREDSESCRSPAKPSARICVSRSADESRSIERLGILDPRRRAIEISWQISRRSDGRRLLDVRSEITAAGRTQRSCTSFGAVCDPVGMNAPHRGYEGLTDRRGNLSRLIPSESGWKNCGHNFSGRVSEHRLRAVFQFVTTPSIRFAMMASRKTPRSRRAAEIRLRLFCGP